MTARTGAALASLAALAALAAACGGGRPAERAADTSRDRITYADDVEPILAESCTGCRRIGGIAPFALTTYDAVYRRRVAIAEAVRNRTMPPWLAERGHRRYRDDPSLDRREIATIAGWVRAGARRGDDRLRRSLSRRGLTRTDLRLTLPAPYMPKAVSDDYRCFSLRWPRDRVTHVTGVDVSPGQASQVHHVAVYLVPAAYSGAVDAWEAAERGPGYTCFGGPGGRDARLIPVQLVGGWTPGSLGGDFPAGTGIEIVPGSRLVLQVHYNLENAQPAPDRTTLRFKLDERVRRAASWVFWLDFRWALATALRQDAAARGTFAIPAGAKGARVSVHGDPRPLFGALSGALDLREGFVVHGVLLHMHRLGTAGRLVLDRKTGRDETLLSIPRWDFHAQRAYFLERPLTFRSGDRLSLECRYDNPTRRDVTWGERSSDEMCVGSLHVSELRSSR